MANTRRPPSLASRRAGLWWLGGPAFLHVAPGCPVPVKALPASKSGRSWSPHFAKATSVRKATEWLAYVAENWI